MLPRFLVGQVSCDPDKILVDVAHIEVGYDLGVQVDGGKALDHHVEDPGLTHLVDVPRQAELLKSVSACWAKSH